MLMNATINSKNEVKVLRPPREGANPALRHANLKLAALRAENAVMKENIHRLIEALSEFEQAEANQNVLETAA